MYLNEIANRLEINRALAKIHLKKLEYAGIVNSRVVLVEGEAKALRYYKLQDFDLHISPKIFKKEVESTEN
jgi:predicted ArsR family transcriptional regulator